MSFLKLENSELLHEMHYVRQKLVPNTYSKQDRIKTEEKNTLFLDLETIKEEILFGRTKSRFQRFDN